MALGFTDSGFVRFPVMGLVVAELVDFVLGCRFLCSGSQWVARWVMVGFYGGFWLAVGRGGLRGVSWWVCGVARGCGRWCLVNLVIVTEYL